MFYLRMTNGNDSGDDEDEEYIDCNHAANSGVHNHPEFERYA